VKDAQAIVDRLVRAVIDAGLERGVQVCAYHRGESIVDAVAGDICPDGPPVTPDTLFPVYSVGKGITATIFHRLCERGLLSADDLVTKYWPAFGAHGKVNITLRHVLTHTAGIPFMPERLDVPTVCDWHAMLGYIAGLVPVTPPGGEVKYHAMTWGWPIGEALRVASGRTVTELVRSELCDPLGIIDLHIGLPRGYAGPIAELEDLGPPEPALPPGPAEIPQYVRPIDQLMNRGDLRHACVPASSCLASARALAKVFAALLPGGIGGVELLSPDKVVDATTPPIIQGKPSRFALGYSLGGGTSPMGDSPRAFGHAGYGGSLAFADPGRSLAVAVTRNRLRDFSQIDTAKLVCQAIRNAID
jgi:CubicO group peptidase (beta-lactamase class C family)